jgi:hypothetical protein
MSRFRTKHDELYLEELEIIANNKPWCSITKSNIIKQISEITFTKDNIKKFLKILSIIKYPDMNNTPKSLLKDILDMDIEIFGYGKMKLRQRIYLVFELEFIDFLLKELVEQNNE